MFLVYGMSNAKYLTFGTPDENALRSVTLSLVILEIKGHGFPPNMFAATAANMNRCQSNKKTLKQGHMTHFKRIAVNPNVNSVS